MKQEKNFLYFILHKVLFFAWEPLRKKLCLGYNEIKYKKKY